jgi:hypothetical protein
VTKYTILVNRYFFSGVILNELYTVLDNLPGSFYHFFYETYTCRNKN